MVEMECQKWASNGIDIKYEIRGNRNGYKAGALSEGMKRSYVRECDYVVVFDADFQPEPDFLHRTIPFLVHNPNLALVQARWKFVNADECLMTRMQQMSLDFHFAVEQEVGSWAYAFFSFNGTAGVWRISAIDEAGGWNHRTTVEDMDLAVRASLKGWKFLYLDSLRVKNELPSTFKALRYQQHRWSCGPANLFRKVFMEINVNLLKKINIVYSFFFVRKVICHVGTFMFYCVVLPTTCLVPEVDVPKWGAIYIPFIVTLINSVGTPRSFHLLSFWILFENVMATHRAKGTFIGLLEVGRVNEWVVTEKLGEASKLKSTKETYRKPRSKIVERSFHLLSFWILFENVMATHRAKGTFIGLLEVGRVNEWVVTEKLGEASKLKSTKETYRKPRSKIVERMYILELVIGAYLLFCGSYDLFLGKRQYCWYIILQSFAFFIAGFGYIGTYLPTS
nr:glucomannan 4-beta-mannosyltransferase 9-like [Ipomoea batatas]